MLVRERMKALGDHAKSSRQPPVKERKYAKAADESAAETVDIDEDIFDKGAAHESAAAAIVDDARPQSVVHENGNGAVAEITPEEEAAVLATVAAVLAKIEPQPPAADNSTTQAKAVQQDDNTSAAKRAIIHEWENWSALHSDELSDTKVVEYFFQHLQNKRPQLLKFASKDDDCSEVVQQWIFGKKSD
jgi:hypothetical protein